MFFEEMNRFLAKKHFSAKRKDGRLSVFPSGTRSVVMMGHCFDGLDGPTKFHWPRSKIKGTNTSEVTQAWNGQRPGWAPEIDPSHRNGKFVWGGQTNWKSEQKISFMTKPQLKNLQQSPTHSSSSTSASFEWASSHVRVTSIKSTEQEWVSQSVS